MNSKIKIAVSVAMSLANLYAADATLTTVSTFGTYTPFDSSSKVYVPYDQIKYIISDVKEAKYSTSSTDITTMQNATIGIGSVTFPATAKYLYIKLNDDIEKYIEISLSGTIKTKPTVVIDEENGELSLDNEDGSKTELDFKENDDIEITTDDAGDTNINLEKVVDGITTKLDIKIVDEFFGTSLTATDASGVAIKTEIQAPAGTKASINADGDIEQEFNIDGKKSKMTTKNSGQSSLSISNAENNIDIEINKGAQAVIRKNGDVVASEKVGSFAVTMQAKPSTGKVETMIKTPTRGIIKITNPTGTKNNKIRYENIDTARAMFSSVKAVQHMESDRTFVVSERRDGTPTEQILPKGECAFEENTYLEEGVRTIVLLEGEAQILQNGKYIDMIIDEEYKLGLQKAAYPLNIQSFISRKIKLNEGWNMITSPYDSETAFVDTPFGSKYEKIYNYTNDTWSEGDSIKPNMGNWVKIGEEYDLPIDVNEKYTYEIDDITEWQFIGTGVDIEVASELDEYDVWIYNNSGWINNPETIYQGQGFWVKK
jgi:hypothetical protein